MTRYTSRSDLIYRGDIMTLYIKTTRDKYEHIVAMGESVKELAEDSKTDIRAVYKGLERFKKGEKCQWQTVEINE